jgi:asparagine synthase (glutamine-hydrolysing)
MSGICGQYNFGKLEPVEGHDLRAMTQTLINRGPDDEGYYITGPLGLGFRRLSIIDLGGGHQPMSDREESVWVVVDGEIYNFPELRSGLEGYGHHFRTNSDAEVVIHGYKHWDADVLNHLNGMFGLAIWDVRQQRLILARDPFGIKPLYYRIAGDRLYFGSEIRAIRATMPAGAEVDPTSLNLFLRCGYAPSPYTILKDVRKLAPGTKLTVQNGSYQLSRWYRFKPTPFAPPKSPGEAREELLSLYTQAIRRQLIGDAPVGLLLSGGVDSGLLLALMNLNGSAWPTYVVGYGAALPDDDLADAAATARIMGSKHTSVLISRSLFEKTLSKTVALLEEPIADSSVVPMYFVCQRARQGVKVALVGQGPDELFGGYLRHLWVHYAKYWARMPAWMRSRVSSAITALPKIETLKRGVYYLSIPDRIHRYQYVLSFPRADEVDQLFRDGLLGPNSGDTMMECWQGMAELLAETDELGGLLFLELRSMLPDKLLMYADKLSMAHGLELRVPFVDKEIVEYVERLPADLKVRDGSRKWLHRQVCREILPGPMLSRPKRRLASNVVDGWFRSVAESKMAESLLDGSSKIYQYFRATSVRELFDQHSSGRHDNSKILSSLVIFEEWLRTH